MRPQLTCPPARAALLFDCDGVLADTEKDGHRVTFNQAFKQKGLKHEWGVELYGELLKIGGGKERMTKCVACRARNASSAAPSWEAALPLLTLRGVSRALL